MRARRWAAALGVGVLFACTGDAPEVESGPPTAPDAGAGADAPAEDAGPRAPTCTDAPFTSVAPVPGLSLPSDEFSVTFTPDELTAYVTSTKAGGRGLDVYRTTRPNTADPFPELQPFAPANGAVDEASVALGSDGRVLLFGSSTDTDAGVDLFQFGRAGNNDFTGTRTNLGPAVNGPEDDMFPYFAATNELFYSRGKGTVFDLWRSERTGGTFQPAALVEELASETYTVGVAVESDGLRIFFGSTRAGGRGDFDVWTASRAAVGRPFSAPTLVPGDLVNTSTVDRPSWISPDGCRLYLISSRPNPLDGGGGRDVWLATRSPQ